MREARGGRDASQRGDKEFGGAPGAVAIIVFSHVLVYYLWISITYYRGAVVHPDSLADAWPFLERMAGHVAAGAAPTWRAAGIYFGFLLFELLLARFMPGVWVKGLPVPTEGNVQHRYLCNGAWSWFVTLATAAVLHATGLFRLTELCDNLGPILTVAVLFADALAASAYVVTVTLGRPTRMSGDTVYDFFMGAVLNPRLGVVDLKFFTEIRVSWILLFLLTASAAAKHVALHGRLGPGLVLMLAAHGLYANACMKGEECIPTTWDVFHEKWGWMLIFWNLVGVPYVYSFNAYYLLVNGPVEHPPAHVVALFVLLVSAYYVWDTAQSQRNRFRMMERGTYVARKTFPQLPWGTLEHPRHLCTRNGGTLLIDGWWACARKIHYTADIAMALIWGLACGFGGVLPYLYPAFFFGMIMHRAARDERRCSEKYGKDWEEYRRIVPNRFLPSVKTMLKLRAWPERVTLGDSAAGGAPASARAS
jgi:delta24(24(1))-sterol reductase